MNQISCPHCESKLPQNRADGRCVACGDLLSGEKWVPPPPAVPAQSSDPYSIYPDPLKGRGTRRWMEMVGVLHRLGYGRLRLACSWENAGPAPVWFGVVAPGCYFRRDHGAILARHPFPEKERAAWKAVLPNDAPMFSSRRCGSQPNYHPWPGFLAGTTEMAASRWVELYPQLAAQGVGEDDPYVAWYARMLDATSPTGLIAAYDYWEALPGYMYVSCGPAGVDRFELPPPGYAGEQPEPVASANQPHEWLPWEVYPTRSEALEAFGVEPTTAPGALLPTSPFVKAEYVNDVLCVHYDYKAWTSHVGDLEPLLRSLCTRLGKTRIVLDFLNEDCVGTAAMGCIYSLYYSVLTVRGRFALCNLSNKLLEFFRWHDGERLNERTIYYQEQYMGNIQKGPIGWLFGEFSRIIWSLYRPR